jgi:hypothetical protein
MAKYKNHDAKVREQDRETAHEALLISFPYLVVGTGPNVRKVLKNIAVRIANQTPGIRHQFRAMIQHPDDGVETAVTRIIDDAAIELARDIPVPLVKATMELAPRAAHILAPAVFKGDRFAAGRAVVAGIATHGITAAVQGDVRHQHEIRQSSHSWLKELARLEQLSETGSRPDGLAFLAGVPQVTNPSEQSLHRLVVRALWRLVPAHLLDVIEAPDEQDTGESRKVA